MRVKKKNLALITLAANNLILAADLKFRIPQGICLNASNTD